MTRHFTAQLLATVLAVTPVIAQPSTFDDLPRLIPGRTAAENALWIETPLSARFNSSKQVVVANLKGPAIITMIHFAMPQVLKLNRDVLVKVYWDGETSPSVECPLVDFFCDPAGLRDQVNTALVNKRRGFNCYFQMPFRQSAKIELVYDGPVEPGEELWKIMPCYSYVMYRRVDKLPEDVGYFHAHWKQEALLLGQQDYVALQAKGRGKFVGWNVTIRRPGRSGYPVDENEKFYIDGEKTPSVEFQGLEDSFGFSWGFPETESMFPLTGYFPFMKGAFGYRFFINDAISFEKSLRVAIGFGPTKTPCSVENSVSQAAHCNYPARCTGIRLSRIRLCLLPSIAACAGDSFLAGQRAIAYRRNLKKSRSSSTDAVWPAAEGSHLCRDGLCRRGQIRIQLGWVESAGVSLPSRRPGPANRTYCAKRHRRHCTCLCYRPGQLSGRPQADRNRGWASAWRHRELSGRSLA